MSRLEQDIQEILLTESQIKTRVAEMGAFLSEEFADKVDDGIVLVSVLRGAAIFMADLARSISLPIELDFMAVSSYGNLATSSGEVKVKKDLSTDIQGKHVIIAEDILDSGLTLEYLLGILEERGPASLSVVAFLRKESVSQRPIECIQVGFPCPDGFIVGYGLDYAQRYRNIPFVGILKQDAIGRK